MLATNFDALPPVEDRMRYRNVDLACVARRFRGTDSDRRQGPTHEGGFGGALAGGVQSARRGFAWRTTAALLRRPDSGGQRRRSRARARGVGIRRLPHL